MTSQSGGIVSRQEYDPWGKVRTGGVTQTDLNYTGQRKDDTGLLYYHARYYDPSLARFVSADSIVPGASSGVGGAGGSVGAWQNSRLTVDFHETAFLDSTRDENMLIMGEDFWAEEIDPNGPNNPQALNRYAYVLNNPVRYVDPTGHAKDWDRIFNDPDLSVHWADAGDQKFPTVNKAWANKVVYVANEQTGVTRYAEYDAAGRLIYRVDVLPTTSSHYDQKTKQYIYGSQVHEYDSSGTETGVRAAKRNELPTPGKVPWNTYKGRGSRSGGGGGRGGGHGDGRGGSSAMGYLGSYGPGYMDEMYGGSSYSSSGQYDGGGGGHGGHRYR